MVNSCSGIVCSKNGTDYSFIQHMGKSQKHDEFINQDTKEFILCVSIYIKLKDRQNSSMRLEIKIVVVSSGKRGETRKEHKDGGNALYLD